MTTWSTRGSAAASAFSSGSNWAHSSEFQDTDPLQAEIVLFLCERDPVAASWDQVALRPGSLTLVADPKQSIYRFRRADIAMYDRVRHVITRGPHTLSLGPSAP